MRRILMLILLTATICLIGCQKNTKSIEVQDVNQVVSAQLIPSHGGASDDKGILLDVKNPKEKKVISNIIKLLQEAKIMGAASDQFMSMGGSPTSLVIKFKNGIAIQIVDAVGAVAKKLDNGNTEVHSESIPKQVTVYQNNDAWRIVSPELKVWIETEWRKDVEKIH
jgi:hypothetical protein